MTPSTAVRCAAVDVALTIAGAASAQHPHVLVPAHWHSMTQRVTLLTGALHVGMGDTLDRQRRGFVPLPAKMHHYA